MTTRTRHDDLSLLTRLLPRDLQTGLARHAPDELLEIILDLGRPPQARFPAAAVALAERAVSRADLDAVTLAVGEFGADNRAGIEGTLHRISALRNRRGDVIGLTLRVGRAVFGTIELIRDLVESGRSVLLLGRPGVGKTTKLREAARVLADDAGKLVVIVDTSNEIAGDGDIPHPAVGGARRMMVPAPERQHAVMIEAVENHMPEVVVVDEIGTAGEALAARTIAERGVQLIGTAHGNTLENLVMNPTLCDLVGGVQTVTLSDEEARLRGTQKTVSERKGPPTFEIVVEIVSREEVIVHSDAGRAVDAILRGAQPRGQKRATAEALAADRDADALDWQPPVREETPPTFSASAQGDRPPRIYAYALSRDSVDRVLRELPVEARTVKFPDQADLILTLKAREDDPRLRRLVDTSRVPIHAVKKNTTAQIRALLRSVFNIAWNEDPGEVDAMVRETERAVQQVKIAGTKAELSPRPPKLRRMQHRIVTRHGLVAESEGMEPERHLVIYPM